MRHCKKHGESWTVCFGTDPGCSSCKRENTPMVGTGLEHREGPSPTEFDSLALRQTPEDGDAVDIFILDTLDA